MTKSCAVGVIASLSPHYMTIKPERIMGERRSNLPFSSEFAVKNLRG